MFNKSLTIVLAVSALCFGSVNSARAEDLSYLPNFEDPIALEAVSQCTKTINKNLKKVTKNCSKIAKLLAKHDAEEGKLNASVNKANNYFHTKAESIDIKYDIKHEKHLVKLAELTLLNQNIGDLIDCVGGFFGFGDADCTEKMAKKSAQIAEQIAKETLKMNQDEEKRDYDNHKNEVKRNTSILKAEQKFNAKSADITGQITSLDSESNLLNDQIVACGGAPVSC